MRSKVLVFKLCSFTPFGSYVVDKTIHISAYCGNCAVRG
jgi:hypothetical protein